MKKTIAILLVLICFAGVNPAHAQDDAQLPAPAGFVNDNAGVLSGGARAQIEALLEEIERKTTAEVVVVTVNTTYPLTIEQYAVELFQKWGIGKRGKDNGALMLVAVDDRKVRIEVGYGLEGAITDLHSKIIIQDLVVPAFKKGNYDLGISSGVVMLAKMIRDEYGVDLDLGAQGKSIPLGRKSKGSPLGSLLTFLFFILIFGFRFGTMFFVMSRGGGYWSGGSGGSFGGGFGGFGGGMSGGGGASGSW